MSVHHGEEGMVVFVPVEGLTSKQTKKQDMGLKPRGRSSIQRSPQSYFCQGGLTSPKSFTIPQVVSPSRDQIFKT